MNNHETTEFFLTITSDYNTHTELEDVMDTYLTQADTKETAIRYMESYLEQRWCPYEVIQGLKKDGHEVFALMLSVAMQNIDYQETAEVLIDGFLDCKTFEQWKEEDEDYIAEEEDEEDE